MKMHFLICNLFRRFGIGKETQLLRPRTCDFAGPLRSRFSLSIKMDSFDLNSDSTKAGDSELQEFLMVEKQKAQFNAQIHEFNDFCWEKCMDKPAAKLDSRTETCITNCVERFLDVSLFITNRFAQLMQKSGS